MSTGADGELGPTVNGRLKTRKSAIGGVVGHVAPILGGKITGGVLVGALITLTGFGPEHWFAIAFENLQLTKAVAAAKTIGLDYRLVLVAVGVVIVAFDVLRRGRREPVAAPAVVEPATATRSPANASPPVVLSAPERPPPLSLVVLPFENRSGEAGQDYFVDGLTDDITAAMSRLSGAFVIARNTAFTFKGKAVDIKQVTHDLNVRYALEGSVRKNGQSLRVTAQLIEGETGKALWAEKFDRQVAQIFELQDALTAELASALNIELVAADSRRSAGNPQPKAIDLIMQAKAAAYEGVLLENYQRAIGLYERALELDPNNVEALGGFALSFASMFNGSFGRWASKEDFIARAEPAARKALSIAPANVVARVALAQIQRVKGHWEEAAQTSAEAIRRDPNCIAAHHAMANALVYLGRYDEAVVGYSKVLILSPRDPYTFYAHYMLGVAEFMRGNYEKCVAHELLASQMNPSASPPYSMLAHAYRKLGRLDESARMLAIYLDMPLVIRSVGEFRKLMINIAGRPPAFLAAFEETMRAAGYPEE